LSLLGVLGLFVDSASEPFNDDLDEIGEVHEDGENQNNLPEALNFRNSFEVDSEHSKESTAEQVDVLKSVKSFVLDGSLEEVQNEGGDHNGSAQVNLDESVLVTDEDCDEDHHVLSQKDNETPVGAVLVVTGNQEGGIDLVFFLRSRLDGTSDSEESDQGEDETIDDEEGKGESDGPGIVFRIPALDVEVSGEVIFWIVGSVQVLALEHSQVVDDEGGEHGEGDDEAGKAENSAEFSRCDCLALGHE